MFNQEYNTQRSELFLKEYGRNIQQLSRHLMTIEDRDKRTNLAEKLVELMRQLNPNIQDSTDHTQKLWDDLFIASSFELDVDAPFPKPDKASLLKKPQKLEYSSNKITYKHYGQNIQLLIDKAIKVENPEEKQAFVTYIAKLMKTFYNVWNEEVIDNAVIYRQIKELSNGKIDLTTFIPKDGTETIDVLYKENNNVGNNNFKRQNGFSKKKNKQHKKNFGQRKRY